MAILYSVLIGAGCGAVWALVELAVFALGIKRVEAKSARELAETGDEVAAAKIKSSFVMKYFLYKYLLNVLMLFVVFLLRAHLPYRWEIIMLSAGLVLALTSQVLMVRFALNRKKA
ncbi:MAG: hypothetical protein IJE29_00030 [Firmicutes bacterium]|nr:hypothetical protein [Bacillota bacterium]